MKKIVYLIAVAALGLMAFKCEGQKAAFNADDQAFCKTNYNHEDACVADPKCEWKVKEIGDPVCRAKR